MASTIVEITWIPYLLCDIGILFFQSPQLILVLCMRQLILVPCTTLFVKSSVRFFCYSIHCFIQPTGRYIHKASTSRQFQSFLFKLGSSLCSLHQLEGHIKDTSHVSVKDCDVPTKASLQQVRNQNDVTNKKNLHKSRNKMYPSTYINLALFFFLLFILYRI